MHPVPNTPLADRRQWLTLALITAITPLKAFAAGTDSPTTVAPTPALEGTNFSGQRIQLADHRNRVVLVLYWSTGCAVCRDKMRELRANLMGWHSQAFTLIGVNMDPRRQDWIDHERLVAQTVPVVQRFPSVWAGDADFRDTMGRPEQLPGARLIDKTGKLVETYRGRIPAEAWDRIAELL
ncbi:TlpA family protein disulfide reductase [Hydrogenophaga sp. A37]|uniref:TlpA family protein disulfide reductase n=1 Tax=Hydrogenophaga sp. A37 TaxID=1945864 RepID=UPI000984CC8F|nr:redoxin domain-containing protein [Hydrogenophaga sp. A37]OOG89553.1 hypothetical protein B0E41_00255 [Hydrogenophaga sp. A37]